MPTQETNTPTLMPDGLSAALAYEGLPWLVLAIFAAGIIRGFSGFGTGLIYVPVAAAFLPPVWVIITFAICDVFGPLAIVRPAWRAASKRDLGFLVLGLFVGVPLGLAALFVMTPDAFRTMASVVALAMLGCLASGLRFRGTLRPPMVMGVGAAGGFLGGSAGLPGPPVALAYLASPQGAAAVRATTLLFLMCYDLFILGGLAANGALTALPLWIGLLLVVPNACGNVCGAALFRPAYETPYRWVAYSLIACAALPGLPIWPD